MLLLALPLFLVADWPVKGWALGTALYAAVHLLDYGLGRTRAGNAARVFGVFFKAIGLLVCSSPRPRPTRVSRSRPC